MMCTRTIATGAGITGSADCPPAFTQSSSLVPLGLWCCAVSSPAAAPGLTRTYMLTAYPRRLHSTLSSTPHSPPLTVTHCSHSSHGPPAQASLAPCQSDASASPCRYQR